MSVSRGLRISYFFKFCVGNNLQGYCRPISYLIFSKFINFYFPKNDYKVYGCLRFPEELKLANSVNINPIQDEGGAKRPLPPTSFPPVTSTNVGIGPKNFLTFSFKPFAALVQNFKFLPSSSPKLLNLNQDHPSKNTIFWVKSL